MRPWAGLIQRLSGLWQTGVPAAQAGRADDGQDARRLAAIVGSSYDAIVGKTLDGRITDWNAAAEKLFGYSAAEAIGRSVRMLIPEDRASEEMRIISELSSGLPVPPFDTLRRTKDGRLLQVSITVSPIRDANGTIIGAAKIARDVTALRQAQAAQAEIQRLALENHRIEAATQAKSLFLAAMSHELRTPLNAIIGFADLLVAGVVPPDSPKHAVFLGHIQASGLHLLQLINDVLDLSKVESGKLAFFPEPVDLARVAREVVDVLHTQIVRKALQVDIDVPGGDLQGLVLDQSRLKQVLFNYLSNAIKFTPEGGAIVLRARPEGAARFRIEVQDTGPGIAAADLPRLFGHFTQLDRGPIKPNEGAGLGLALTKRLVEAQGGSVGALSTVGVGSVFFAVLDRVPASPAAEAPPARSGQTQPRTRPPAMAPPQPP